MLLVYDAAPSPYAQKVKMALLEKGIAFETRVPDFDAPEPDFVAVSPRLEVPALVDDDMVVFDSSVILEYIEDRWPEPRLLPTTARERARVRMLEEVCDTQYDAVNWGVAEILVFKRVSGEAAEPLLTRARAQTTALNARLDLDLQTRPWLNGDQLGFGDIAAYPFVNTAAVLGNKPVVGSRLETWLLAMRTRPSAERLKQDVIDSLPVFLARPAEIAAGKAKREYRDHRLDWMMRSGGMEIVMQGLASGNIRFSKDL